MESTVKPEMPGPDGRYSPSTAVGHRAPTKQLHPKRGELMKEVIENDRQKERLRGRFLPDTHSGSVSMRIWHQVNGPRQADCGSVSIAEEESRCRAPSHSEQGVPGTKAASSPSSKN